MENIIRRQGQGEERNIAYQEIGKIIDVINDAVTIHDMDFNIIFANGAASDLLGIKQERILKDKCYKSYHGTDCPPDACPSYLALRTGKPATQEIYEPCLKKHIEIRAFPRFDGRKRLTGLGCI